MTAGHPEYGAGVAAPADGAAFTLRGVSQEREGVRILDGVDLGIQTGRVTALIGPSGSGKTSLLRLLNRLDDPTAGEIRFRDRRFVDVPVRELRCRVGFVAQLPVMFPGTVRDNLSEAAQVVSAPEHELDARVARAIALAQLDPALLDRDAERLSVGQQRRVTIARALMTAPEALLLDEPTAGLDPPTAGRLLETVKRLVRDSGLTVLFATHRLEEARAASDETVVLTNGRVAHCGPTERVLAPGGPAAHLSFSAGSDET